MEVNIVGYSEEDANKALVNRQIKDRISTCLNKYYNVKYGKNKNVYILYTKPVYAETKIQNIVKYILYHLDFLIQDILNSDKYWVMTFAVDGNEIKINAYDPKEVVVYQGKLEILFNSIDGVKITINKKYFEWEYN